MDQNKGFFLKSFFSAILPKDRNIFSPLTEFIMWRRTTLTLGIFSLMLFCFAMSGVMAFSYFNNVKALNNFDPSFFKNQSLLSTTSETILLLDRQRFEIEKLQTSNDNWILPRLGLNHSLALEKNLKQKFVNDARKNLVDIMDDIFFQKIKTFNSIISDEDIVERAVYTIQRINILKSAIQNDSFPDKKEFEKTIRNLFPSLEPGLPKAVASKFVNIYYSYLTWNDNHSYLVRKLEAFQNVLSQIAVNSNNFNWLLSRWICLTNDIEISNFLKGYQINQIGSGSKAIVKGAFTRAGRQEINQFIKMIQKAFTNQEDFLQMENDFRAWYAKEFYRSWFDFASVFPSSRNWKSLVDNWTDLGTLMTTDQNPYFMLMAKMGDEFEWMRSQIDLEPAWAKTVVTLKEINYLAQTEIKKKEGSLIAKLSLTKEKITDKFGKTSEKIYKSIDKNHAADLEYKLKFAKVWNEYNNSLKTIASATSYSEKGFHMFDDFFKALSDPSKQQEPFNLTYDNLLKLNSFLKQNDASPVVLNLIKGPFDFLAAYGIHQSVKYLQDKWEEIVLSAAYSIDPDKYYSIMFDKSTGVIWQFINEEASAFIGQNKTGFSSKTAFGLNLPFNNRFFKLLNKGEQLTLEQQDEYVVSITTLPISVNNEAEIRPYSNTLIMECADEKTELVNNNFPETQKFTWRPGTCGDVVLEIQFDGSLLQKKYKGRLGFSKFLSDFQDGTKIFNVTDFPEYAGYLTNNNVTDIIVSYEVNDIEPVLNFMDRRPPVIPDFIFKNYKRKSGKYPIVKKPEKKAAPVKKKEPEIRLKDLYTLSMKTLPMEVNASAKVKPKASIIRMQCKDVVIRFENNNYPESIKLNWEPANCGKVLLTIQFPEFSLLKEYQTFFEFVKDFNYESRTFISDEFPEQREALMEKDISAITISYEFTGDLPLLGTNDTINIKSTIDNSVIKIDKNQVSQIQDEDSAQQIKTSSNEEIPINQSLNTKEWILKQEETHYTIHVMMGNNKEKMIQFAEKNNLLKSSAIYESLLNGQKTYNLILGAFISLQNAKKSLEDLSDSASRYSPWIRKFASIKKEIK
ncbi:MAG: hypothetical protein HN888_07230 [Desulfobacula sp.]|nr:hypothetical protein [Desulfobacula sp.]